VWLCLPRRPGEGACWGFDTTVKPYTHADGSAFAQPDVEEGFDGKAKANYTILYNLAVASIPAGNLQYGNVTCVYAKMMVHNQPLVVDARGPVVFSLNTHVNNGDPDDFPSFANNRQVFVRTTADVIPLDTPVLLWSGDSTKCAAAFPATFGAIPALNRFEMNDVDSVLSSVGSPLSTDILASIAVETLVGSPQKYSICEAGWAMTPHIVTDGTGVAARTTVFSFPK
jgi:hypothetical protein